MIHPNKNELTDFFYNEISAKRREKVKSHLSTCSQCSEYISILNQAGTLLNKLPDMKPAGDTFDRILAGLPREKPQTITEKSTIPILPIFEFALAIVAIVILIFVFQEKLSASATWETLQKTWLVRTIGSFGFVALSFFGIGSFITFSITPILYLDSLKSRNSFAFKSTH